MNAILPPHFAAVVVAMILVAGCSVYSPRTEVEPRIELRDSFPDTGLQVPDRWWEDFSDPELTQVIEATLDNNLSLRMAWARLDQMQALTRIAGAGRYPNADLAIGAERQKLGGDQSASPSGPQDDTINTMFASLTVAYQLDLWKKISNTRKAAILDQQASRQDVEATALMLTGAAGELWYGIAAEQATLQLLDEQLEIGQSFLNLVQLRFANGLSSAVDVFQQRLQVETTRSQIPAATTRLATRTHQMAVLLGREPRARIPLPAAELPALPPLPATGVPLEVLRARPDVRATELQLMASDHRLAVAIADRYPTLSFSATLGGQAENFSDILDQWFLNLAGNLLAPIFDGGRRTAEADRNRAVVKERFYAWESAVLSACTEVEDALVSEHGLHERSRILATQLELAGVSLDRSRALYANGLTDYLTVLTSLQALQNLQRQAISTQQELLTNRIRLYLALGGSWSRSMEDPTAIAEEQT
ncbi:MAG: efflux transporter outer membrane subunit [Thermoanaerobaculales bacterium]|nr:efflux transporter outer membrane subunit [Thermoanaerobaculales bacterium]